MFIIATLFSLFTACEKSVETANDISGNWGLVHTQLYKNEVLNADSPSNEITTYYEFDLIEENQLIIREDGELRKYEYTLQSESNSLILDNAQIYKIESLSTSQLILSKSYSNYRSIYTFLKVG